MEIMKEHALELLQAIESFQTIIIHRHINPDPDAIGSQLGLRELLKAQYPDKKILAAGTISKGLAWMGQMDPVSAKDYQNALVIVLDTPIQSRIDGEEFDRASYLVKVDHHILVENFADLEIVHVEASSTAELLTLLIMNLLPDWTLTAQAATYFYAGIVGDTGRFLHSNTRQATFEAVSFLMAAKADLVMINRQLNEITFNELKFQSFAIDRVQLHPAGLASMRFTLEDLEATGVTAEATNAVTNLPGRLAEVLSWVVFIEQEEEPGTYRARLRSKGPQINQIAMAFNGGGHAMASGATVKSGEELQALIDQMIEVNKAFQEQV